MQIEQDAIYEQEMMEWRAKVDALPDRFKRMTNQINDLNSILSDIEEGVFSYKEDLQQIYDYYPSNKEIAQKVGFVENSFRDTISYIQALMGYLHFIIQSAWPDLTYPEQPESKSDKA